MNRRPEVILADHKYACFAFCRFPVGGDVPDVQEVSSGVWVLRRPPVDPDRHWRDWLGSLRLDYVRNANFVLLAALPSTRTEVLDGENVALVQHIDHWYRGLLLLGVPLFEHKGVCLTGGSREGGLDIRQFSDLDPMHPSYEMPHVTVTLADLTRAHRIAVTLNGVVAGSDWERFGRGFSMLYRGLRETDGGRRLRHFVQALEGLVKPPVGKSKALFVHRCLNPFVLPNALAREALEEMYDIRSYVEHLHPPLDALSRVLPVERLARAHRRTRQGEVLARFTFTHVLESAALLGHFQTETTLDAFWQRPDHERVGLWESRCDLAAIA
jgi:hypothetical protein